MAGVEAAASLFGEDASSGDPFASLGISQASPPEEPASGASTLEAAPPPTETSSAADFFDTFGTEDTTAAAVVDEQTQHEDEAFLTGTIADSSTSAAATQDYAQSDTEQQGYYDANGTWVWNSAPYEEPSDEPPLGYYDEHGDWQYYDIPLTTSDAPVESNTLATQQSSYTQTAPTSTVPDAYNPYAPVTKAASSYAPPAQAAYSSNISSAYTPSTSYSANTLAPVQATEPVYDPYKPTNAPAAAVSPPQPNAATNSLYGASSGWAAPKPPVPVQTPLYRPKTANAFDPPLPPPKPKRKQSSFRSSSPAIGQQTYPPQSAPQQAAPPPPFPRAPPSASSFAAAPPSANQPYPSPALSSASSAQYTTFPVQELPRAPPGHRGFPGQPVNLAGGYGQGSSFDQESSYHLPPPGNTPVTPDSAAMSARTNISDFEDPTPKANGIFVDNQPSYDLENDYDNDETPHQDFNFPEEQVSSVSQVSAQQQYVPPTQTSSYDPPPNVPTSRPSSRASNTQEPPRSLSRSSDRYAPAVPRSGSPSNPYGARTASPLQNVARTGSPSHWTEGPSGLKPAHPPSNLSRSASPYDPGSYAPTSQPSAHSVSAYPAVDPYAPSVNREPSRQSTMQSSFSSGSLSYGAGSTHETSNEISFVPTTTSAPYAPSPSLIGSNDPLGRTSSRAPVIRFGFGGKFVTCSNTSTSSGFGYNVALSSRETTKINIRKVFDVIPPSSLGESVITFPGPLFGDYGTPVAGLVRPSAQTTAKTKKAAVLKYLDERIAELEVGLPYQASPENLGKAAEGKLVLVRILKVLVEFDGRVSGSPEVDLAIRKALLPQIADTLKANDGFSTPAYAADSFSNFGLTNGVDTSPLSTTTLRQSDLTKIQDFILRGERQKAYQYASQQKLWAHALVIASGVDKEAWQEVVSDFLQAELSSTTTINANKGVVAPVISAPAGTSDSGREWLRVVYALFAGQGAASVQQFGQIQQTGRPYAQNAIPQVRITPMSPNFPTSAMTARVPPESMSQWAEAAAAMIGGPSMPDTASALTALGDYLVSNGWTEAAHSCYLLSPSTSPLGGPGSPSTRVVLVGSLSPHSMLTFHRDPDSFIFTEIAEFAASLTPTTKGSEAFQGYPHLQAYRFIRANFWADVGRLDLANRYCEAITNSLGRPSPYFTSAFLSQIKGMSERLMGAPQKAGWNKITKPSLDSIGNWLEGRLTKFIEGDSLKAGLDTSVTVETPAYSAFSHFSSISSAVPSTNGSPAPSTHGFQPPPPPSQASGIRRTGSAMAHTTAHNAYDIDRSSSAMGYSRPESRVPSPGPQKIVSASAAMSSFSDIPSYGYQTAYEPFASQHLKPTPPSSAGPSSATTTGRGPSSVAPVDTAPSWWTPSQAQESATSADGFPQTDDEPSSASGSGFVSLMDDHMPSISSYSSYSATNRPPIEDEDDEEDLGFGNSKPKPKPEVQEQPETKKETSSAPSEAPRPDIAPNSATNGSWIGRWLWKKDPNAPAGPVKANLGEEMSLVFDKDLKKWVSRRAGEVAAPSAPQPPPPPRAQTASPGKGLGPGLSVSTPPPRPASVAAGGGMPPPPSRPATANRLRSNLAPTSESEDAMNDNSPPPISAAPPPKGKAGGRKNIRSRYVDVMQ